MIMELVLRDLIKSWKIRKLAWSLDDFVLAAICCADDVVLVAASVAAAEVMVAEVIAKMKEVGLTVGAQRTQWTSHPKMVDKNICGVEGVCGRKCKIRDRTQICSSQQAPPEVETRSEFFMAPKKVAPEHCENHNVEGFSLERVDRRQRHKETKLREWSHHG